MSTYSKVTNIPLRYSTRSSVDYSRTAPKPSKGAVHKSLHKCIAQRELVEASAETRGDERKCCR